MTGTRGRLVCLPAVRSAGGELCMMLEGGLEGFAAFVAILKRE